MVDERWIVYLSFLPPGKRPRYPGAGTWLRKCKFIGPRLPMAHDVYLCHGGGSALQHSPKMPVIQIQYARRGLGYTGERP